MFTTVAEIPGNEEDYDKAVKCMLHPEAALFSSSWLLSFWKMSVADFLIFQEKKILSLCDS